MHTGGEIRIVVCFAVGPYRSDCESASFAFIHDIECLCGCEVPEVDCVADGRIRLDVGDSEAENALKDSRIRRVSQSLRCPFPELEFFEEEEEAELIAVLFSSNTSLTRTVFARVACRREGTPGGSFGASNEKRLTFDPGVNLAVRRSGGETRIAANSVMMCQRWNAIQRTVQCLLLAHMQRRDMGTYHPGIILKRAMQHPRRRPEGRNKLDQRVHAWASGHLRASAVPCASLRKISPRRLRRKPWLVSRCLH